MINEERSYELLSIEDLKNLKKLALQEHKNFFKRNPHLRDVYYNSLIGICLCQGAAFHYINPSIGIKDFDIWHFYKEHNSIRFPYRTRKRIEYGYKGRPIDFLKRAIPNYIYSNFTSAEEIIMNYLLGKNTKTKRLLLKKAIIGLYPDEIFNKILWKGEL